MMEISSGNHTSMQVGLKFLFPAVPLSCSRSSKRYNLSSARWHHHDLSLELFEYVTQGANCLILSPVQIKIVSKNYSFKPQQPGQCPFEKLRFYHRRMLQPNSAVIEIAMLIFFWLYSMTWIHKPIFQHFLFFSFFETATIKTDCFSWRKMKAVTGGTVNESSNWRNCTTSPCV